MLFLLETIFTRAETLFPAAAHNLPAAVVYTNEKTYEVGLANLVSSAYAARQAKFNPIVLGRLPRGVILCGGEYRALLFNHCLAIETVPAGLLSDHDWLTGAVSAAIDPSDVDEECLLLTRFGHGTWGHWLGEILPTAAIVERLYPGRFRYAVPHHGSFYGAAMRESLRAYGIEANRILQVSWTRPVRFANSWAVTPIWSDFAPHPSALDVMRGAVRLAGYRPEWTKVALMRRDSPTRGITNDAEVEDILRADGYTITDAATLPFVDQVRMFQSANDVFAVVGSGLTGLIYSPSHVRVLTVRPAMWRDRFFYSLAQHRDAKWAEVCGSSRWEGGTRFLRDAPFDVPVADLMQAKEQLATCG